jgi:hypothetical protein
MNAQGDPTLYANDRNAGQVMTEQVFRGMFEAIKVLKNIPRINGKGDRDLTGCWLHKRYKTQRMFENLGFLRELSHLRCFRRSIFTKCATAEALKEAVTCSERNRDNGGTDESLSVLHSS